MIVYGYAKNTYYNSDGSFYVRVRIPSIHGPYQQSDAGGQTIHNYVPDDRLPAYPSLLLSHEPSDGEVVALMSTNEKSTDFIVIGLTGGTYTVEQTNESDVGVVDLEELDDLETYYEEEYDEEEYEGDSED